MAKSGAQSLTFKSVTDRQIDRQTDKQKNSTILAAAAAGEIRAGVLSVRLSCLSVTLVYCPNGRMNQDETWHGCRPRPWPYCVRWGPSPPPQKGAQQPPLFGPWPLRPNGLMDQDDTWFGGMPWPTVLDTVPVPPPSKMDTAPIFDPCLLWQTSGGSRSHLVRREALFQATLS